MNSIVSLPIVAAVPVASPAIAAATDDCLPAQIARLEQAIEVLRTRYVCEGWKLDEEGAERALRYWRTGCPDNEDQTEWGATLDFCLSHGLSMDWIMTGEVGGMICHGASHSRAALRVAATADDPILAAIEAHRKAYDALNVEIVKTDALEALIPKERRKSSLNAWEDDAIVETDDPRWIEHQQAMQACNRSEDEATCELAELIPTSPKGMLALLEYMTEHEESSGCAWPDLYENETSKWARSFLYFVSQNITQTLRGTTA